MEGFFSKESSVSYEVDRVMLVGFCRSFEWCRIGRYERDVSAKVIRYEVGEMVSVRFGCFLNVILWNLNFIFRVIRKCWWVVRIEKIIEIVF